MKCNNCGQEDSCKITIDGVDYCSKCVGENLGRRMSGYEYKEMKND